MIKGSGYLCGCQSCNYSKVSVLLALVFVWMDSSNTTDPLYNLGVRCSMHMSLNAMLVARQNIQTIIYASKMEKLSIR